MQSLSPSGSLLRSYLFVVCSCFCMYVILTLSLILIPESFDTQGNEIEDNSYYMKQRIQTARQIFMWSTIALLILAIIYTYCVISLPKINFSKLGKRLI